MNGERKPGRKKPGAAKRKRRYSEPSLPKSVPSRKTGINQHKEEPDPLQKGTEGHGEGPGPTATP